MDDIDLVLLQFFLPAVDCLQMTADVVGKTSATHVVVHVGHQGLAETTSQDG